MKLQPAHPAADDAPGDADDGNKLRAIVRTQRRTLRLFLSNPSTRTPSVVLYVASFGGALHAAVTTYFYLAVGASETDIGHFGFAQGLGALLGNPISGWALDARGPWAPLTVTAGACALGCLWRGAATSLASLRAGAMLLGIGINMWTVVLGHLVKSFPASMRSEVLSGFGVQMTVLQLCGKGTFPLVEYCLHRILGLKDELLRYRIHMGTCTFFCFYGVFALFWDRENVKGGGGSVVENQRRMMAKYQETHSDVVDELAEIKCNSRPAGDGEPKLSDIQSKEIEMTATSNNDDLIYPSYMSDRDSVDNCTMDKPHNTSSSSFLNQPELIEGNTQPQTINLEEINNIRQNSKQLVTTITLTFALLVQSTSTTILTVLWPLLANDIFDLPAHTFGVLLFLSSVVSTGAVASFPVVERLEKIGGRVRCAAWGFALGSVICILFCFFSFGDYWTGAEVMDLVRMEDGENGMGIRVDAGDGRRLQEHRGAAQRSQSQFVLHAASAIAFQASLCFLEPSLKSIFSLTMNSSSTSWQSSGPSLGLGMGLMNTLGSIGGMVGNLAGTWMYKVSKDISVEGSDGHLDRSHIHFRGGSLPFVVTAVLMALSSLLIWRLEEPTHVDQYTGEESKIVCVDDVESGISVRNAIHRTDGSLQGSESDRPDGCCLALRETTYNPKLD